MVEALVMYPLEEITRLEDIEREYNEMRASHSDVIERMKTHKCDHSHCEKKYSELNEKYEHLKKEKSQISTQPVKKRAKKAISKDETQEPEEREQKAKPTKKEKPSKKSEAKELPWYKIGSLHE